MSTASDCIEECRHYLQAGHSESLNRLNGAIDGSATTLTLDFDLGAIQKGSLICIDTEMLYVWDTTQSAKTLTVQRAMQGSNNAVHADGALVQINPLFSNWRIFQAMNDELIALSAPSRGLFKINVVNTTYTAGVYGYDLTATTTILDVLEVRYDYPGVANDWPHINSYHLDPNADLTEFPSGNALVLEEGGFPGRSVKIVYSTPFTALAAITDNLEDDAGLPPTATDVLALGAALRLQSVREGQRNFNDAQGDTRRAQEVGAGAQNLSARGLQQLYSNRLRDESGRLRKLYPYRRRVS